MSAKTINIPTDLAIARDYPDEYILSYTRESLKLLKLKDPDFGVIPCLPPGAAEESGEALKGRFEPARSTRVTMVPNPEYQARLRGPLEGQLVSFLIARAVFHKERSCKVGTALFAFAFTTAALAISWADWRDPANSSPYRVLLPLALGIVAGAVTLLIHLRQVRKEPLLAPTNDTAEIRAFRIARKAKNASFTVGLLCASVCLIIVGMCELFGFSRVEATISTFALLVLALEAVAIGAFFDLKQQQAVKRITKEAEIRLDPFRYIVVEEVRAQA